MFDVNLKDSKYHPKDKIIGLELGGKAYTFSELSRTRLMVNDIFDKIPIQIHCDRKTKTAVIRGSKNNELPSMVGFSLLGTRMTQQQKSLLRNRKNNEGDSSNHKKI